MFKVVSNRTFTRKIEVQMPTPEGGFTNETFKAKFAYLSTEDVKAFDLGTPQGTTDFLRRVIVELSELTDETGASLSYDDQLRDQIIFMPNVRLVLVQEYLDAVTKSKAKN